VIPGARRLSLRKAFIETLHIQPVRLLAVRVLLIHGLGRTPLSLQPLANYLNQRGHPTESLGYVADFESYTSICDRLQARMLAMTGGGQRFALCGHSLGGLLALSALSKVRIRPGAASALITLGTPLMPPRLARRFKESSWFRLAAGDGGQRLADPQFFAGLQVPPIPWLRIIGTGRPTGKLSPFGGEPNDGVVALDEAAREGAAPTVLVDAVHTFLMNSTTARYAIDDFLRRIDSSMQ
jgi:pimeloyl-ACP methyl ester carboxylesterase